MAIIKGRFAWPGVMSPVSGTYTISHSISPGTPILKCLPQNTAYGEVGDLIITDDNGALRVPDCKLNKIRREYDGDAGFTDVLEILDWRWKWAFGSISGCYNQLDDHGKLVPWLIRSPTELAILCFQAMGVTKYLIDLPPGLTQAQGLQFATLNPPWLGVVPVTGTNPPVNWVNILPAQALENLANQYGRRVIPRLGDYTIMVAVPGIGKDLPPGSISKDAIVFDSPETPSGVGVIGGYTKYQVILPLEPVGIEWDGSIRPVNNLSYAPRRTACVDIWKCILTIPGNDADGITITVEITGEVNHVFFATGAPGDTPADLTAAIAATINADPDAAGILVATSSSSSPSSLILTGQQNGVSFTVAVTVSGTTATFSSTETQPASDGNPDWSLAWGQPPLFEKLGTWPRADANVVTSRLTFVQARELAQKSIGKYYRITGEDASGNGMVNVPGYGRIIRRQQLILQDTMVEQIVPVAADLNLLDKTGMPFIANFYNGYSRDKPAEIYGSVSTDSLTAQWFPLKDINTINTDQVFVPFAIDAKEQLVIFNQYIGIFTGVGPGKTPSTNLVLKTGVFVRHKDTNEIERYKVSAFNKAPIGFTNFVVRTYEDVQLNVIGKYAPVATPFVNTPVRYNLTGSTILEQDPLIRSQYYLEGMKSQYFPNASGIREYNGFVAWDLDGAIQQVTWDFGDYGCGTTISRNTEHELNVPPYPARRRRENLPEPGRDNIIDPPLQGRSMWAPNDSTGVAIPPA